MYMYISLKVHTHTQDLVGYMNPFHNMAKYRELQRATRPPFIPLFPIIKKDLTFLFDGNETQVDGLVNFEKLRMLSQQIRNIRKYCETPIMVGMHASRSLMLRQSIHTWEATEHETTHVHVQCMLQNVC